MRRAAARRVYVEETLRREGRFGAALDRAAGDLQRMLGLGVKEAGEVREDIVSKTYRRAPAARRRACSPCPVQIPCCPPLCLSARRVRRHGCRAPGVHLCCSVQCKSCRGSAG